MNGACKYYTEVAAHKILQSSQSKKNVSVECVNDS
jgi:hypothetical protein